MTSFQSCSDTCVSPTLDLGGTSLNVHRGGQVGTKWGEEASRALGVIGNGPQERLPSAPPPRRLRRAGGMGAVTQADPGARAGAVAPSGFVPSVRVSFKEDNAARLEVHRFS